MTLSSYLRSMLTAGLVCLITAALGPTNEVRAQSTFGVPRNLGPTINSAANEAGPHISADGRTLYYHSDLRAHEDGVDLWNTSRDSLLDPWHAPTPIGPFDALSGKLVDQSPCLSSDGKTVYFNRNTSPSTLWTATVSLEGDWEGPTMMSDNINMPGIPSGELTVSADGLTVLFSSLDRPGGQGNWDLWQSTRASIEDDWGPATNMGAVVNTAYQEHGAALSADGLMLVFDSSRPDGIGGSDLWLVQREAIGMSWQQPKNLTSVNTIHDEYGPMFTADGTALFFAADAGRGGYGGSDIWMATLVPEPSSGMLSIWLGLFVTGLLGPRRR